MKSVKKNYGKKKNKKENKRKSNENKSINLCELVKSQYLLKEIFTFLDVVSTLKLIKKNKTIQKKLNISIDTYSIRYKMKNINMKKNNNLGFDQLYEITTIKYPKMKENELVNLLFNFSDKKKFTFYSLKNSDCLQGIIPLLLNSENKIQNIELNLFKKAEFSYKEILPVQTNLLSIISVFNVHLYLSKFTQNEFDNLVNYISFLPKDKDITICINGINFTNFKLNTFKNILIQFNNIIELKLSELNLDDKTFLSLEDCLLNKTNLKKLDLSGNFISEKSLNLISRILVNNQFLEELDLSSNFFASYMIKTIDLSGNFISNKSIYLISRILLNNQNLEELDLKNNFFTSYLIKSIGIPTNNLIYLDLGEYIIQEEDLKNLDLYKENFQNLKNFYFNNRTLKLDNNTISKIKVLKSLESLKINCDYDTMFFDNLSELHSLKELYLNKIELQSEFDLSNFKSLINLNLKECSNVDKILKLSNENVFLITLNLENSNLDYTASIILNKFLLKTPNLIDINISNNNIYLQNLLSSFRILNKLEKINISKIKSNSDSLISFSQILPSYENLTHFDISENNLSYNQIQMFLLTLLKNINIQSINFSSNHFNRDGIETLISFLRRSENLNTLILRNINLNNEGFKMLLSEHSFLVNAKYINLGNNKIDEKAIKILLEKKDYFLRIEYLNLSQLEISKQIKNTIHTIYNGVLFI